MASIVLAAAGSAVGSSIPVIGPVIGSAVGESLGRLAGGFIDDAVFGTPTRSVVGPQLSDLSVQVSTYGKAIPVIYGNMRIAGNVIWSQPIKETATTSTSSSGGGKGGGGSRVSRTSFNYSVSLAIAICEGEIEDIVRVWADAKLLDLSLGTYRVHKGGEEQLPDPLIESIEGIGATPAYRGLAYVVIEDFPLEAFGNRIPNFTFEIKRPATMPDYGSQSVEEMVTSMTLIPGAGEFVYDTVEQVKVKGKLVNGALARTAFKEPINRHTPQDMTNAVVSIDQLLQTCPNLEWVSIIVTWFGDDMDAGQCSILPGVEFKEDAITEPDIWHVGGYDRDTARQITLIDNIPRYGGTPDDNSVLRYVDALKARGLKVMMYPMFFMDVDGKPWRGRVTGSPVDVASFFTKSQGFNEFVTHYAQLTQNKVNAFVIGSELIGLTKVTDTPGNYPAVNALVSLAATVKSIMGSATTVTYAADWSEYHHTEGGWYNLDPLWASPDIDVIGIDAYFPITNAPQNVLGYDVQTVIDGWDEGEGYDFFYSDAERTVTAPLAAPYAWKNIDWFWKNTHHNPDGNQTAWVPESKKIWFTEYGFPSVDGATNQPNVFYDPASVESFFPRMSRGLVDIRAQRAGIAGTEARWQGSPMLERLFLWTWDARPFPYFPDLSNVWADGDAWAPGHWVTGKFGVSGLAAIIRDLCLKAGLSEQQIDVSALTERVDGYVITRQTSARKLIEELMVAYFFDVVESNNILKFVPRGNAATDIIHVSSLVREKEGDPLLRKTRQQEVELPQTTEIVYLDRIRNYERGTQRATRQATESRLTQSLGVPLVLSGAEAHAIIEKHLYTRWQNRLQYRFMLDVASIALEPTDVITLEEATLTQTLRITNTLYDQGKLRVDAVSEDVSIYEPSTFDDDTAPIVEAVVLPAQTDMTLLDIPALPGDRDNDAMLRIACAGTTQLWDGAAIYRADNSGEFNRITQSDDSAMMGMVSYWDDRFLGGNVVDETSRIEVILLGDGAPASITEIALLNGANAASIGNEIIQFRDVVPLGGGVYRLQGLLRGRLGTEYAIGGHHAGESFVLLNEAVFASTMMPDMFSLSRDYKAVTFGSTLGVTQGQSFIYRGVALKPYAPVHLAAYGNIEEDIELSWIRRDRIYGAWRNQVDIGLAEQYERYEVDVFINDVFARTLTVSSPLAEYSISMQSDDGLLLSDTLRFDVMQLSSLVGRGHTASYAF